MIWGQDGGKIEKDFSTATASLEMFSLKKGFEMALKHFVFPGEGPSNFFFQFPPPQRLLMVAPLSYYPSLQYRLWSLLFKKFDTVCSAGYLYPEAKWIVPHLADI